MTATLSAYAALILPDASAMAPERYVSAAARVLAPNGARPITAPLGAGDTRVMGDGLCLTITPEEDSDYGPRILITATSIDGAAFCEERAAKALCQTVLECLKVCDADIIEWFAPDTLIDTGDFLTLHSYVSPRRGKEEAISLDEDDDDDTDSAVAVWADKSGQQKELFALFNDTSPDISDLPPPSQLTDRLLATYESIRDEDPAQLRLAAANWAMTGTVALISPPMGASMTVMGLARGLDFRRVTQAVTLTAFFILLHQQGIFMQLSQSILH